ncbi:ArsR/SmtB family transcription factor [Micromonospora sp. URMC 103]|uniref:ArsR/SmtB family transcription factor n=1 Tax=Micromonospora sp. URMC 103 TaxID=3423406 RepID=UPI003F1C94DC
MVTLHLNAADLSRTTVRSVPSVLLELAAAGQRLFRAAVPEHLVPWRARTRAALRPSMRPYLDLCRLPGWLPDFVTPPGLGGVFPTALRDVAGTPPARLALELAPRVEAGDLPSRVAALARAEPVARQALLAAMRAFHHVAVAPYWAAITGAVQADRVFRGQALAETGIDRVLRDLSPVLSWRANGTGYELSYRCEHGIELDVVPDGRGVTLVPSYFLAQPSILDDPDGPLVLAYPVRPTRREPATGEPLAALLGRTRATVLGMTADGPSTSQLASALGISVASASQHASTLRAAGLITSHRDGVTVRHTLTPLGGHLLRAGRPG